MPDKQTPDDFGDKGMVCIMQEAQRLIAMTSNITKEGLCLDEMGALFIVSQIGHEEVQSVIKKAMGTDKLPEVYSLEGIPYRVTCNDEPDTPRIQLVMEPMALIMPSGG